MRVAFLINSLAGGGAEKVMVTLLRRSHARLGAHDLHLILLDDEPRAYAPPDWLAVHQGDGRFSLARSARQATSVLRTLEPDVCLSFLTRSNLCNVAAAAVSGHRAIISERANTLGHHKRSLSGRASLGLVRACYPLAERVIVVASQIGAELRARFGVREDRLTTIHNPVEHDEIVAASEQASAASIEGPYIVGMGRLVPGKNFALLLRAFASSSYPGRLAILGEGPEREELKRLAGELAIADRVCFLGFQSNPFPILRGADGYVLPSNGEGFPNGLIEAMALGIPVISTNCASGPSEILDDAPTLAIDDLHEARYGLLVPVNAVEPMRAAIDRLRSPEMRARLSNSAVQGARRYDADAAVSAYWRAIEGRS